MSTHYRLSANVPIQWLGRCKCGFSPQSLLDFVCLLRNRKQGVRGLASVSLVDRRGEEISLPFGLGTHRLNTFLPIGGGKSAHPIVQCEREHTRKSLGAGVDVTEWDQGLIIPLARSGCQAYRGSDHSFIYACGLRSQFVWPVLRRSPATVGACGHIDFSASNVDRAEDGHCKHVRVGWN